MLHILNKPPYTKKDYHSCITDGSSSDVLSSYKDPKISMKTDNNPTWIIKYFHDPFAVNIKALPCKQFGEREFFVQSFHLKFN